MGNKSKRRDMGRPPLSDEEDSVPISFRAPASLVTEAKERAKAIGFYTFGEFIRYCLQSELHKKLHSLQTVLKVNELRRENIDLRAEAKGKKKKKPKAEKSAATKAKAKEAS